MFAHAFKRAIAANLCFFLFASSNSVAAQTVLKEAWLETMNACEALISNQSFEGFESHLAASSILNVEPRLERGFDHPVMEVTASAISDGSEWFLCVVTGKTDTDLGGIVGTVTGTLFAQIEENQNHAMVYRGGRTLAPMRIICRGGGRLTSVFAYFTDGSEFRVAATNRLPVGAKSPCS